MTNEDLIKLLIQNEQLRDEYISFLQKRIEESGNSAPDMLTWAMEYRKGE